MILAGDIGGTKTNLALFPDGSRGETVATERYASQEHAGLDEIVRAFVAASGAAVDIACFGVAGPVKNGRCETTNLPWIVDAAQLARELDTPSVWVINDLEANAYGLAALAPSDLLELHPGTPGASGNAAIIAAGTGLGEAGLFWDGRMHRPFATEGGHASFAPLDDVDLELLRWLAHRLGHVSWERVVSGPGLVDVYRFLRESGGEPEPAWLADAMRAGDPAAAISGAALEGRDPVCAGALDRFVTHYGAEAGNLALKVMATGGLYVGGGIAPKILPAMRSGTFLRAFTAKGRMRPLLEAMAVRVVLNDRTALLGAARCAALRAGGE
jgi:glucokinase